MGTLRAPTSRYPHALLGSSGLSKIAHLSMSYSHCKVLRATPVGPSSVAFPRSYGLALLQQPRHQLIQPSFRLNENILLLNLLYVLLAKLDSWKFTSSLRILPCIVKVSRLVFSSPPAIRAQHGKPSRHTERAVHRNFARARRTAHAAHDGVGADDFAEHCHSGLLSCLRGLSSAYASAALDARPVSV
jgi:hypothetical protein